MTSVISAWNLTAWLAQNRADIDELLSRRIPSRPRQEDPGRLIEAIRYSLLAPGKRIRPLLGLAAVEALGVQPTYSVRVAIAAVELLHCYSLIHDDLPAMDNSDLRRGRPTSHKAFGEATAILAGDGLLTLAFEWIAEAGEQSSDGKRYLRAGRILADAAGIAGMVRGQARDLGEPAPTNLADIETLHREKTGALFRASLELGACVGGATAEQESALARYGVLFGVAFQHADDLSDNDHPEHAADAARRLKQCTEEAVAILEPFGPRANALRALAAWLAQQTA